MVASIDLQILLRLRPCPMRGHWLLVTHSCRCLQAPDNAVNLLRTLHSSGMVYGRLGQSQNVEHAVMILSFLRVNVATLSCRRSSSVASL